MEGNGTNHHSGTPEANGLRDLLLAGLKDMYWAEKTLTRALAKMAKQATSPELIAAIEEHLAETETHVDRIEQVFRILDEEATPVKCDAMAGLLEEAEEMTGRAGPGVIRDAAIIAAAQKAEHYEIASYGTLVAYANTLGEDEVGAILHKTLEDEKKADDILSKIAESSVNLEAAGTAS